jgi:hypothetical protein
MAGTLTHKPCPDCGLLVPFWDDADSAKCRGCGEWVGRRAQKQISLKELDKLYEEYCQAQGGIYGSIREFVDFCKGKMKAEESEHG